jgi:hypothetical protein
MCQGSLASGIHSRSISSPSIAADGLDHSALADRPAKLKHIQLPKEKMFDKSGQWIHLETFDDFDNGLSDLIDLWSSTSKTTSKTVKESALAHFKEDLEAAVLKWIDNRAKSKKYASIGKELAEFQEALKEGANVTALEADSNIPVGPANAKKKA